MAESRPNTAPRASAAVETSFGVLGAVIVGVGWYYAVGLLHRIDLLEGSGVVTGAQYVGVGLVASGAVFGIVDEVRKARAAARARKAAELVSQALERIKAESPTTNVDGIPAAELAAFVTGAKVNNAQLVRLVEQQKQQLLIDEASFRTEVAGLIVDYLQPLPRNAKRVLNRFRVNLLIADRRGLFTSEPKISKQQIGKWLVLAERWPQLRLALSAVPERIKVLEERCAKAAPAPPPGPPGQAPVDPFMDEIKALAPFYVGDEDLRRFIDSEPRLALVLPRLVHYGDPDEADVKAKAASP